jgi:nucleoside-diphosphate kinase
MEKKEKTLVLIKPDGIVKSLVGNILTAFSETKLKIVGAKVVNVNRTLAEAHYKHLKESKPDLFEEILAYLQGKHHKTPRVMALIYEGEDAVKKIREICGETNPEKAHPITLRGKYGRINSTTGVMENVVHASDSIENALKEIGLWFKPEEIAKDDLELE